MMLRHLVDLVLGLGVGVSFGVALLTRTLRTYLTRLLKFEKTLSPHFPS